MTDRLTPAARSQLMAKIRSTNTGPEKAVRSILHRMGYRFSLHRKDLPGSPDIVLPKYRTVILVHGCFWHRHQGCRDMTTPATRKSFWENKFDRNVARDRQNLRDLRQAGWHPIVVWECELRNPDRLKRKLAKALPKPSPKLTPYPIAAPKSLPIAAESNATYGRKTRNKT